METATDQYMDAPAPARADAAIFAPQEPEAPATAETGGDLPLECFPESVVDLIKGTAKALGTDHWMPFAAILKNVCGIVGANIVLQHHSHKNPAHLWVALACDSGGGKSTMVKYFSEPLHKCQTRWDAEHSEAMLEYDFALKEYEAAASKSGKNGGADVPERPKKPQARSLFVDDATPEYLFSVLLGNPTGVVWDSDELAAWMRAFGRYSKNAGSDPTKSRILGMYDGMPMRVGRIKNQGISENVPAAWLSVFGTVQPGILPKLFAPEDFLSGFLQRFLFIFSDPQAPEGPKPGAPTLDDFKGDIAKLFSAMLRWRRLVPRPAGEDQDEPEKAFLSEAGRGELDRYFLRLDKTYFHLDDGGPRAEFERTRARRWKAQCSRLILIMHCIEQAVRGLPSGGGTVRDETVQAGINVFRALIYHAERAKALMMPMWAGEMKKKTGADAALIAALGPLLEDSGNGDKTLTYTRRHGGRTVWDALVASLGIDSTGELGTRQRMTKKLEGLGFRKKAVAAGLELRIREEEWSKLVGVEAGNLPAEDEAGGRLQ